MARPRKPTAVKRLEGTWRKDRDGNAPDVAITHVRGVLVPEGTSLECPATVKTDFCRTYWRHLTESLVAMRVLGWADLPELEGMVLTLEKLREARKRLSECSIDDKAEYARLLDLVRKLEAMWHEMAPRYFVSPVARQKMVLDGLNIEKTAQEVEKNASPVDEILSMRRSNGNAD